MSKVCPKCEKVFDEAVNFCSYCGAPLVEIKDDNNSLENKTKNNTVINDTSSPLSTSNSFPEFNKEAKKSIIGLFILGLFLYWIIRTTNLGKYDIIMILPHIVVLLYPVFRGSYLLLNRKFGSLFALAGSIVIAYFMVFDEWPRYALLDVLPIYPMRSLTSYFYRVLAMAPTALLWAICVYAILKNNPAEQTESPPIKLTTMNKFLLFMMCLLVTGGLFFILYQIGGLYFTAIAGFFLAALVKFIRHSQ